MTQLLEIYVNWPQKLMLWSLDAVSKSYMTMEQSRLEAGRS